LVIVLPVLRYTDSDYPFGIFKLFLYVIDVISTHFTSGYYNSSCEFNIRIRWLKFVSSLWQVWWFSQGSPVHSTTGEQILSPRFIAEILSKVNTNNPSIT